VDLFDGRSQGRGARYLLTGVLYCGRCGGRMNGRGGKYICSATGPVHLSAVARSVEEAVREQASERPDREAEVVHDPSEPLVRQREGIVGKMEALGESDLPDAVIRGRARKLQRELDSLDEQLAAARPKRRFAALLEEAEAWDERGWLEGLIERAILQPAARGANRFDPARVAITWQ
jgi:hypothetical protein